jgi:CheY-like chemotaxis protein
MDSYINQRSSENFILLADDDEDDRMIMNEFFLKNGYEANSLNSGLAAIEHLVSISPDLYPFVVLLDYSMPLLTGQDVLRFIKASDQLKHLPVMIYSSEMNEPLKARLIALGATACFSKTGQQSEWDKMKNALETLLASSSRLTVNI